MLERYLILNLTAGHDAVGHPLTLEEANDWFDALELYNEKHLELVPDEYKVIQIYLH